MHQGGSRQLNNNFTVAGLDVVQEKETILSETNLETLVAGQTSNESMEGVDKLLGSSCTLLYLRYGISMNEWDVNQS